MAHGLKFKEVTIRGVQYIIYVDGNGIFNTNVEDAEIVAITLDELEKKVMKSTTVKINQPFARFRSPASYERDAVPCIRRGFITGKHGRTGNLLVSWPDSRDGKKEQETYYGNGGANYLKLTPEEEPVLIGLYNAVDDAKIALDSFITSHKINLKTLFPE